MQYDNTNRGALWANTKRTNPKAPKWTGTINIRGEELRIAMWDQPEGSNPRAPEFTINVSEFVSDDIQKVDVPAEQSVAKEDVPF